MRHVQQHQFLVYYSCGLSTATIEYSWPSVCVRVCVSVCVCVCVCVSVSVYRITQKIMVQSTLNLYILYYMKIARTSSTLGIVRSRSRSPCDFEIFLHLPQYKLSSPISQLWNKLGSCD